MKRTNWILGGMTLAALAVLLAPTPAHAQDDRSGTEIWAQSCGNCHSLLPAAKYEANRWATVMTHMRIYARLTKAEGEAVLAFLTRGRPGGEGGAAKEEAAARSLAYVQSAGGAIVGKLRRDEAEDRRRKRPIRR